jgi:hypothetical protein
MFSVEPSGFSSRSFTIDHIASDPSRAQVRERQTLQAQHSGRAALSRQTTAVARNALYRRSRPTAVRLRNRSRFIASQVCETFHDCSCKYQTDLLAASLKRGEYIAERWLCRDHTPNTEAGGEARGSDD